MRKSVFDLSFEEVLDFTSRAGEPAYRARQIWQGIYQRYAADFSELTDLPVGLRRALSEEFDVQVVRPIRSVQSTDRRTTKTLLRLRDGQPIESVLMRYDPDSFRGRTRRTACISTQAGCAMGCSFCATGQMGFRRNLSSGEIVAQVIHYASQLRGEGDSLTNVVFMGMGEPFHNYDNFMAAIARLSDPDGFGFGARRMTVSTVGLVPQIRRFADEGLQVNLAVSLHAVDDAERSSMMPVNRKYPIQDVINACRYYVERTGRRITFEWALIGGVNDTAKSARDLARLLKGLLCHVNCIPLNPTLGYSGSPSPPDRVAAFQAVLRASGVPCTVRARRGVEIGGGCGQLVVV